jgi:hypothetical protein
MRKELCILCVEDVPADVVMLNHALRERGMSFRSKRVNTQEALKFFVTFAVRCEITNTPMPNLPLAEYSEQFDLPVCVRWYSALVPFRNERVSFLKYDTEPNCFLDFHVRCLLVPSKATEEDRKGLK